MDKLLRESGVAFATLNYYLQPLSEKTLRELIKKMALQPREPLRAGDAVSRQLGLGKKRVYYLVVPDQATAEHPAPLLLLLHGSGRNGLSLIDKWKDLAIKEGIVLVGPDAINSQGWNSPADGPDFLHDVISDLKSKY